MGSPPPEDSPLKQPSDKLKLSLASFLSSASQISQLVKQTALEPSVAPPTGDKSKAQKL